MYLNQRSYPYSYIIATKDKSYKNYLIDSTITGSEGYSGPIGHYNGENIIRNVNISDSQASWNSVYVISGNSDLNATVSYSTFIKNIANNERCFLYSGNGIQINHCNIISNKCLMASTFLNGVISAPSNVKVFITDCIISNNKGKSLFYAGSGASITVSSCFIPSNNSCSESELGPGTKEISTTDSLNIENAHISTALCYANHPLYYLGTSEKAY